jgi:hypothetical protein
MAKQEEQAKQAKRELRPPLADNEKMPIWLQAKENYGIWQRNKSQDATEDQDSGQKISPVQRSEGVRHGDCTRS